jgi:predicted metal-dependent hydrolase
LICISCAANYSPFVTVTFDADAPAFEDVLTVHEHEAVMTIHVDPIRRNLKFLLPKSKVNDWNPGGRHITQFYNTLSIFFPAGERFFIQSVRHFRERLTDPSLRAQISAFIGQEGFHTREHEDYNAALQAAGLPVAALDQRVVQVLEAVKRLPPEVQLATTVALEHLTAVLGDTLLRDPGLLADCDPHFAALWRWHAIEETEHKAVCFDAYEQVMGKGVQAYLLRSAAFVLANAVFWGLYLPFLLRMLQSSGGRGEVKGWATLLNFVAGRPGVLRRVLPEWLDFFRPGFHPWMHDNRHHLALAETLVREVAGFHQEDEAAAAPATEQASAAGAATAPGPHAKNSAAARAPRRRAGAAALQR